jgi:hypothetical protein
VYLADRPYPNVLVHCIEDPCRNNVGNWPTRQLVPPHGAKGFDYYSVKDRAMAQAASFGLMLWDGKSKGTVNNVVQPGPRPQAGGCVRRTDQGVSNDQNPR